mmetsp:Transcript_66691/g.124565  ORF Transcript_66691/g.124565 Transcript_66691/m.124565 type:complete len:679 (-) Transcript_66691:97-2133(-)
MAPAAEPAADEAAAFSITLPDVEATEQFGAALAEQAQKGDVFFLKGELGSGKTSLARGFLRHFFADARLDVPSPSYLLHFVYSSGDALKKPLEEGVVRELKADGSAPHRVEVGPRARVDCPVHHIDPFRLPAGKIASLIDFDGIFTDIALVEWPDRLGDQIVKDGHPPRLDITFAGFGPQADGRSVTLTGVGPRWPAIVAAWKAAGAVPQPLPVEEEEGEQGQGKEAEPVAAATGEAEKSTTKQGARSAKPLPANPADWKVLGIESSCDDTGAAILSGTGKILGEALASQAGIHSQWGGVVPKLAQEAHSKAIDTTVEEALKRAGTRPEDLTAVAVTVGPGLGLCLEVGVRKALKIAATHRLPLVRVHHMEAHTLVTRLPPAATAKKDESTDKTVGDSGDTLPELEPAFPFITLLVSGGHNMAVLTRGIGRHHILGSTIDDSIGEAFDKTARCLGITQVPGGPHLERMAKEGTADAYNLPRPLSKSRDPALRDSCDVSFSGLKTATRTLVEKELSEKKLAELSESEAKQARANIACAFQRTAVDHLCQRAAQAVEWAKEMEPSIASLVVAGGVAANQTVRQGLTEVAQTGSLSMRCPPPRLCVDNGVMVAWTGVERLHLGLWEEPPSETGAEHVEVRPRWPLGPRDARSQTVKGPKPQKAKRPAAEAPQDEPAPKRQQ